MNIYRTFAKLKLKLYIYQRELICMAAGYVLYPQYFVFRDIKTKYIDRYNREKDLAMKHGMISSRTHWSKCI